MQGGGGGVGADKADEIEVSVKMKSQVGEER